MLFGNEYAAKAVCDYDASDTGFKKDTLKSGVSVDVKMCMMLVNFHLLLR